MRLRWADQSLGSQHSVRPDHDGRSVVVDPSDSVFGRACAWSEMAPEVKLLKAIPWERCWLRPMTHVLLVDSQRNRVFDPDCVYMHFISE